MTTDARTARQMPVRVAIVLAAWALFALVGGAIALAEVVRHLTSPPLMVAPALASAGSATVAGVIVVVLGGLFRRQGWAASLAAAGLWLLVAIGALEVVSRLPALHVPLLALAALLVLGSLPGTLRHPRLAGGPATGRTFPVLIAVAIAGFAAPLATPVGVGLVDRWSAGPALPVSLGQASAAIADGYIFVVGSPDYQAAQAPPAQGGILQVLDVGNPPRVSPPHVAWSLTPVDGAPELIAGGAGRVYLIGAEALFIYELYRPGADGADAFKDDLSSVPLPWFTGYRTDATATVAADGRLLVIGGHGAVGSELGVLSRVDVFDPATGVWTTSAPMTRPRAGAAAVTLGDGTTLVLGGRTDAGGLDGSVEALDPITGRWRTVALDAQPRQNHAATVGADGRVYVFGGFADNGPAGLPAMDVAILDPDDWSWSRWSAPSAHRRPFSAAVTAPDGRILLIGGGGGTEGAGSRVDVLEPLQD